MSVEFYEPPLDRPILCTGSDLKGHHLFRITKETLMQMFDFDSSYCFSKDFLPHDKVSRSLVTLRNLGGTDAVIEALKTDRKQGINGSDKDIDMRLRCFGENISDPPQIKGALHHVIESVKSTPMQLLFACATLTLLLGLGTGGVE